MPHSPNRLALVVFGLEDSCCPAIEGINGSTTAHLTNDHAELLIHTQNREIRQPPMNLQFWSTLKILSLLSNESPLIFAACLVSLVFYRLVTQHSPIQHHLTHGIVSPYSPHRHDETWCRIFFPIPFATSPSVHILVDNQSDSSSTITDGRRWILSPFQ